MHWLRSSKGWRAATGFSHFGRLVASRRERRWSARGSVSGSSRCSHGLCWFCAEADQWTVATTGTPASSAARMRAARATLAGILPRIASRHVLPPRYLPRRRPLPICPRQFLIGNADKGRLATVDGISPTGLLAFCPRQRSRPPQHWWRRNTVGNRMDPGSRNPPFCAAEGFLFRLGALEARLRPLDQQAALELGDRVKHVQVHRARRRSHLRRHRQRQSPLRPTGSLPTTRSAIVMGEASPLGKLVEAGGKVLMVGAPSTQ